MQAAAGMIAGIVGHTVLGQEYQVLFTVLTAAHFIL